MESSNLSVFRAFQVIGKLVFGCWILFFSSCADAQEPNSNSSLYYPPTESSIWEETNFQTLGWDGTALAELLSWLPTQDTRAFIILKDGKIVVEEYWGNKLTGLGPMDQNSFWYWASAGKTLTASLIGLAEDEKLLSLKDRTQEYLGKGWTSMPNSEERDIRIRHHLSMTTGLDDQVAYPEKTNQENLVFKAEAGERWAYHNAPYTLLDQVITNASGMSYQTFFKERLGNKIGMKGMWQKTGDNNVFYSDARSMARFGLLLLANGKWDNEQIGDRDFFEDLHQSSQDLNPSYGYLTWLNGKNSYMVPQSQQVLPGSLVPQAPADMYQAMGKNGQFVMVVPSQNLVIVRMGGAPGDLPVPFLLIRQIWDRLGPVLD
ncbi:serine hydrolase domain-containing protein [Algoriphagus machipongonensis]|uniref:Beta-lactamase n=1 Tax=Algoriphagus machipongonensis TaxID=388413 RepID=A3I0A3_9BACT|nr:serine hydrolase [Algoriphagus machipongonensis]EAZ79899.1 beta-lactamase [Algoriphagus machipongonensis]